jgi:hypothetical protein
MQPGSWSPPLGETSSWWVPSTSDLHNLFPLDKLRCYSPTYFSVFQITVFHALFPPKILLVSPVRLCRVCCTVLNFTTVIALGGKQLMSCYETITCPTVLLMLPAGCTALLAIIYAASQISKNKWNADGRVQLFTSCLESVIMESVVGLNCTMTLFSGTHHCAIMEWGWWLGRVLSYRL